jgi:single-stranded-DNA-specific exonuclease
MKGFLDILTIAIIADIMPLKDINRTLVKEGLKAIATSQRPSSIIIRDFLNKKSISSEDIAFQIAPRINSAGRLEDASIALEFLTATTTNQAYRQFEKLNSLNEQRREIEAQTTKEAIDMVKNQSELPNVIVVVGEDWHEGVVGIIASRLVEHFERPAIVLSINNGVAKGSARSLGNIDIFKLIQNNKSYLTKFGGHKMAAGLTLEEQNIELFRDAINQTAAQQLDSDDFIPLEDVIGMLPSSQIDFELLEILENFEPYGEANSRPLFLAKDAKIIKIDTFGKDRSHSKIIVGNLGDDKKEIEFILFKNILEMPEDKRLTCTYRAIKNEFNLKISVQLIISKIY